MSNILYHVTTQPVEARKITTDRLVITHIADVAKMLKDSDNPGKDIKVRFAREGELFKTLKNMDVEDFDDEGFAWLYDLPEWIVKRHFSKTVYAFYCRTN
ncbi:hypothetical protein MA9V2_047 [Chryseobacterium phage MA9V-2]|nr:hypothetical protein MA9V2_047 [Chryseobacterium phage MA9V-2]